MDGKLEAFYDMINLKNNKMAPLFCLAFFSRRILIALAVLFLNDLPFLQIWVLIFTTLLHLGIVGIVGPLPTPTDNRYELFDNFVFIIVCYCLLCFTDFVPSPITRYYVGYGLIAMTFFTIFINVIHVAAYPVKMAKLAIKKRYRVFLIRKKLDKAIEKRFGFNIPKKTCKQKTADFFREVKN